MLDARKTEDAGAFDSALNLRAVGALEQLARRFKQSGDRRSLREIVRLLVAASGHDVHDVRDRSNVTLERVFAPKPFDAPLATSFLNVRKGETHQFTFTLPPGKEGYFLRLYNCPAELFPVERDLAFTDVALRYDRSRRAYVCEHPFFELGHYDYLICRRTKTGVRWLERLGSSGRVNVIPDLRGELVLEIFTDVHGHTRLYWDDVEHPGLVYNENGEIIRVGRFSDVAAHLEDLKRRYHITALYLLGAQKRGGNRDDWAPEATSPSPFAPMSLTEMEPSLGGGEELRKLVHRAHLLGIKVIVDLIPHLNRSSAEVPEALSVRCADWNGNVVVRASTDGRYGSWNDGKLLNYRKLEVWEWLAESVRTLIARYDIDGVRFDSCHAVPIMMKKDNGIAVQGRPRSHEEMVEGTIVVNEREDDHFITTGYYESACRATIASPFHYYFMRTVEQALKQKGKAFFVTLAECYWGREPYLARSGIIPYNAALFKICENILHGKSDVKEIYHLYDDYLPSALPQGTELVGILGNHDERRALNTFGHRGLRAVLALTSFMSNVVMDYEGSAEGESWKVYADNIYVDWNRFEQASHRSLEEFYGKLYGWHHEIRGTAHMIESGNTRVAASIKVTETDAWIGAFSFSENNEVVSLELDRADLPIDENAFYRLIDAVYSPLTGHTAWYSGRELRRLQLRTVVPYTDRVKLFRLEKMQSPVGHYEEFLRDSLVRLSTAAKPLTDSFAVREVGAHLSSPRRFRAFLAEHLPPLCRRVDRRTVEIGLKRALYYAFRAGLVPAERLYRCLECAVRDEREAVRHMGEVLRGEMQRGPLVFLAAEAEPFSKAGGIADVTCELPRELAALGEEVFVITPKYRYGDPGAECRMREALEEHNVLYTGKNLRFMIQDKAYEVGVHHGTIDRVHYFLLDHYEFFDGLYWGYTAEEKLRRRIAFARACAELIVAFDLQPMATFTNDAYAGIFNGVVRADPVYSLNPNFLRTSFFHIIHNGGWQYFDCYHRYERGFDHYRLFNLPENHASAFSDPIRGENINCMAAGVRFADRVITVSPKYAEDLSVAGDGLEGLFREITGISNGVRRDFAARMDARLRRSGFVETWYRRLIERADQDPALRRKLEGRYPELLETPYACASITDPGRRGLVTRMRNKLLVQLERGLIVDPDRILLTMIHRLVEQKGFQLLLEASAGLFGELGCEAIVGGPLAPFDGRGQDLARGLEALRDYYPGQVSVAIGLQELSSPLLASDVFLMPSLYEPGGISQLEALACGCLVVARATGGLQDTVQPIEVNGEHVLGSGFLFSDPTAAAFYHAVAQCVRFCRSAPEDRLQELRQKARDSLRYWDDTARLYLEEIYSTKEIVRVCQDRGCGKFRARDLGSTRSTYGEGESLQPSQAAL